MDAEELLQAVIAEGKRLVVRTMAAPEAVALLTAHEQEIRALVLVLADVLPGPLTPQQIETIRLVVWTTFLLGHQAGR